jgi:hypothetical protein
MARGDIEIRRTDSIRNEFDRLHQAISQRAYELFRHRDSWSGAPLIDWLSAEHELVWLLDAFVHARFLRRTCDGFYARANGGGP